jgi:hypothetical protein
MEESDSKAIELSKENKIHRNAFLIYRKLVHDRASRGWLPVTERKSLLECEEHLERYFNSLI